MRRYAMIRRIALAALAVATLLCATAWAEEEEASPYVENEWNYVDGSIDVSGGIPADAEGALADIRERGMLKVATEPYFPPQEYIDPHYTGQEKYLGADMALARTIARRMGVDLVIVPMDFTQVLTAVNDGDCDLAISALSYTPGRASTAELSKGYYFADESAGSGLLIRAEDAGAIKDLGDLAGRDIAAQRGSLQEMLMADNVSGYHQFRRIPKMKDLYDALESGVVDAVMVDVESAESYIESNPGCGLMIVPGVRFHLQKEFEGDRVAGKKGELQLMYFVNGVIDEVLESGQYLTWYRKYDAKAAELGM